MRAQDPARRAAHLLPGGVAGPAHIWAHHLLPLIWRLLRLRSLH